MRLSPCWIASILFLFISTQAGAYYSCNVEKQATLPVTFNSYIPTVPAIINGQTVNLGIDLGAQETVITPQAVTQLHLPQDMHRFTRETGMAGTYTTKNIFLSSLRFAGIEYKMKSAPVVAIDTESNADTLRKFGPAAPMAGLIGTDILSNYDIEYDAPGHMLNLYHVLNCNSVTPPWKGPWISIPVSIAPITKAIVLPATLNGHKISAIFDTGASGMALALGSLSRVGLTPAMIEKDPLGTVTGAGALTRKVPSHYFSSFIIGPETFRGTVSISDYPNDKADMLIGEAYMLGRRFWISYATQVLFVQHRTAR